MPKYVYHCNICDDNFEIVHGMTEKQIHCELCKNSDCLVRIPQMPHIKTFDSNTSEKVVVGSLVNEAIKENAEILKEQKKEAASMEWKEDV